MAKLPLKSILLISSCLLCIASAGVVTTENCQTGGLFEELTLEGCSGDVCKLNATFVGGGVGGQPEYYQFQGLKEVTAAFTPNRHIRGGYTRLEFDSENGTSIYSAYTCDLKDCPLAEGSLVSHRLKINYDFVTSSESFNLLFKIVGADDSLQVCRRFAVTRF